MRIPHHEHRAAAHYQAADRASLRFWCGALPDERFLRAHHAELVSLGVGPEQSRTQRRSARCLHDAPRALRLAVAAYLARFKGISRNRTESDPRCYLTWCAERGLDPLAAQRPHLELYIRWMQEIRRFKPSTVSRRFSVAAGFYRTCVIDGGVGIAFLTFGRRRRTTLLPLTGAMRLSGIRGERRSPQV